MKTYGILCFVLALFMILTPLLSLDYSSFSLSNVKSTFQKENDSEDEEKLLDEKSDSVKIKSAAARAPPETGGALVFSAIFPSSQALSADKQNHCI